MTQEDKTKSKKIDKQWLIDQILAMKKDYGFDYLTIMKKDVDFIGGVNLVVSKVKKEIIDLLNKKPWPKKRNIRKK